MLLFIVSLICVCYVVKLRYESRSSLMLLIIYVPFALVALCFLLDSYGVINL